MIHELTSEEQKSAVASFMNKVYGWMSIALAITALTAMYIASDADLIMTIISNKLLYYGLFFAQIGLVWYISGSIDKISAEKATLLYLAYSMLLGVTLSIIFIIYTSESIASTFMVTALTFGAMSLYGFTTKKDLTSLGSFAFMALIGLIIATVVNMFLQSSMLNYIIGYAGVLIFVALTAYDTQKIKKMAIRGFNDAEQEKKGAIMGALTLYLDFINLFLFMLRFLGDRK